MKQMPWFWRAVAGTIVLATVGTACGSDDDGAASTTASGTDSTPPVSLAPSGTAEGSRAGEVIKIGFANNEGPAVSLPDYRRGGEAAIDLVNASGGIDGATIEVVECLSDATPEGAVNCANNFVDADVALYFGGIDLAGDAALPVLTEAGVPYVTTVPWGVQMRTDPNVFVLGASQGAYVTASIKALADAGAKHVASFQQDLPSIRELTSTAAEPAAEKVGVELETIYVSPVSPDWAAAVSAAVANGADGMWISVPEAECTNMIRTARSLGFDGPIAASTCGDFIGDIGADAVGVSTIAPLWMPDVRDDAPTEVQQQLDEYLAAMDAAGASDASETISAALTFAAWMELADVLRGIGGPIDAASVRDALQSAHDIDGFLQPPLRCGVGIWPSEPTACSASMLVLEVVDSGGDARRRPTTDDLVDYSDLA